MNQQNKKSNSKSNLINKNETEVKNQNSEYLDWRNLQDQYDPSLESPNSLPLDMR